MNVKEKKLKKELIEATKAVRRKFQELHSDKLSLDEHLEEKYKPITKSLRTIIENQNIDGNDLEKKKEKELKDDDESRDKDEYDEYYDADEFNDNLDRNSFSRNATQDDLVPDEEDVPNKQSQGDINWSKYNEVLLSKASDTQYGVRRSGSSLKIGKYVVKFHKTKLRIRSKDFPVTTGLLDLLFYKKPPSGYTTADLQNYKDILFLTDAHKKFFEKDMLVRSSKRSYKYTNIISPLMKSGSGIDTDFMTVNSNPIDYTYWDNPNELVDRLRLLVSSSSAGHTGHNNEIISIIEELREANIIE